jgi:predicted nucleic acid-binding protein
MLVVDTNIIFPCLVRSAITDRVEALRARDAMWHTEPFALVELSNVLATYEQAGHLTLRQSLDCLGEAESWLGPDFVSVPHGEVLELAVRHRVSAYDARFLAVAKILGQKLVTEDKKLRAAAPRLTQSLAEALAVS